MKISLFFPKKQPGFWETGNSDPGRVCICLVFEKYIQFFAEGLFRHFYQCIH